MITFSFGKLPCCLTAAVLHQAISTLPEQVRNKVLSIP